MNEAKVEETYDADLIVVGAGAGGMAAALTAALEGLKVILCEASSQVGGTTATSAGTLWIPGNNEGKKRGYSDSEGKAKQYLDSLLGEDDERGLRDVFLSTANRAIEYLEKKSSLQFSSSGKHPDYLNRPGAAIEGRALSAVEFDGRKLGRDFRRIRAPLPDFMVLGGMMVNKADIKALVNRYHSIPDFLHGLRLVTRYGIDRLRYHRGTRLVMGNALVGRMFYSLTRAGVNIRFNYSLNELLTTDSGKVIGGVFINDKKEKTILKARYGVVLATGGLANHSSLRKKLAQNNMDFPSLVFEGNTGDGLSLALKTNARLEQHENSFFWQPVSKVIGMKGGDRLFPHLYLDRTKPGLIAVDSSGVRFTNEADSYHHFVANMLERNKKTRAVPCYFICDANFIYKYGLGVIPPGTKNLKKYETDGYVFSAATPESLAEKLGIDPAGLCASINKNNQYAEQGNDLDFGKGDTELNRFNGDQENRPNPCLGKILGPGFYALPVFPADAASSTGLAVNSHGNVLDNNNVPITGLYACGNDMASIMKGVYPGPGITIGPAIVFGYIIGEFVGSQKNHSKSVKN
ncbi:MAG: FAD-dependent oxidoreductase [Alcaligenaceae bacterium]|nr:FAD-dependent oxidoreductase [Alcaligenaceae bacterium]